MAPRSSAHVETLLRAKLARVAEVVRRMLQRRPNDVTDFEIRVPELVDDR
jgi:hypothetical protein